MYSISHFIGHIRESNVGFSKYESSLTTKTSDCCFLFRHQCEMSCEFMAAVMDVQRWSIYNALIDTALLHTRRGYIDSICILRPANRDT